MRIDNTPNVNQLATRRLELEGRYIADVIAIAPGKIPDNNLVVQGLGRICFKIRHGFSGALPLLRYGKANRTIG
ncbi:MAG: hypothetical protein ACK4TC_13490 [Sphingomonas pseudosanguinis]|uniref:hypothetical protein n=1 Tax=Sphingomonas pseudosanguinis TaxID=413712 RepID=UPI003919B97E